MEILNDNETQMMERADENHHNNDMKLTRDPRRLYEPQSRLMLISEQAFSWQVDASAAHWDLGGLLMG